MILRAIITLAAFVAAVPAYALEPGQCLPRAQIREALDAEGQIAILGGELRAPSQGSAILFYSPRTLMGYVIRKDTPLNEPSNTSCVDAKFSGVALYPWDREGFTSLVFSAWSRIRAPSEVQTNIRNACSVLTVSARPSCTHDDPKMRQLERAGHKAIFLSAEGGILSDRRFVSGSGRVSLRLIYNPATRESQLYAQVGNVASFVVLTLDGTTLNDAGRSEIDRQERIDRAWMNELVADPRRPRSEWKSHREWDRLAMNLRFDDRFREQFIAEKRAEGAQDPVRSYWDMIFFAEASVTRDLNPWR